MSYKVISTPEPDHLCRLPERWEYRLGTIVQCETCGRVFKRATGADGWMWISTIHPGHPNHSPLKRLLFHAAWTLPTVALAVWIILLLFA